MGVSVFPYGNFTIMQRVGTHPMASCIAYFQIVLAKLWSLRFLPHGIELGVCWCREDRSQWYTDRKLPRGLGCQGSLTGVSSIAQCGGAIPQQVTSLLLKNSMQPPTCPYGICCKCVFVCIFRHLPSCRVITL